MYAKGQVDPWGVGGLVALLVLIAIGALVTYEVTGALDTESGRSTSSNLTVNSTFENTASVPDNWDNTIEPVLSSITSNAWNSSGYVTTTRTDNGDNIENGVFYQSLTISTTRDGISSATTSFSYRVIDNENAGSINIVARLGNGLDNFTLFDENVTGSESASWTSVDNDVSDNITTTGTYTLWLRAEINPAHGNAGAVGNDASSCIVGFDDASISVSTYGMGYSENAIGEVEEKGATVFSLLSILAIVIVAALIIGVVIRSIGGGVGRGGR